MSEMQSNSNPNDFDNEIELREIFSLLWQKKVDHYFYNYICCYYRSNSEPAFTKYI